MVCDECGAAVPADARWCGHCGASTVGTGTATLEDEASAVDRSGPAPGETRASGRRRRVLLAVVGVLAVVGAAIVVTRPSSVPTGTLGHIEAPGGLVADGPLPSGELSLAWQDDPGTAGGPVFSSPVEVLGRGLVGVDQLVVDTATGETVGALPAHRGPVAVGDGRVAFLVDGERVTHDVRTGEVVDRVPLTGIAGTPPFAFGALPDGTISARAPGEGVFGNVLVAPDGAVRPAIPPTVVEEILGVAQADEVAWQADHVGPVFVVEVFAADGPTTEFPARHLVDATTGALLGPLPDPSGGPSLLVPIGETVTTVVGEQELWSMGSNGEVSELELVGPEQGGAIRLLGAIDDQLVLAHRGDGGSWDLWSVPGPPWSPGSVGPTVIGTVDPPPSSQRSSPSMTSPPGIVEVNDATVTDELVVVVDDGDGEAVVAHDLTGTERWRRPVAEGAAVSAAGDLVLVTESSATGNRATLLDGNGEELWGDVTGGPRISYGPRLVHGDVLYTDASFPIDAVSGEKITERAPGAPEPGEAPLAVIDDPDGLGTGVLATRRTGGADGTGVVTIGDEVVVELTSGEFGTDRLVGIANGVLLVREWRVPSADRLGLASMTETAVLVQPDGTRIETDGTFSARPGPRPAGLAGVAVVSQDDSTALLDPTTGERRFVLPSRVTLAEAGDDRLVAERRPGWWVVDAVDGATVGERREQLVHLLTVGAGLVAAAGVDGSLEVVRAADGQTAWRQERATIAPPVMAFTGDHLLVGTRDGRIVEHDEDGQVVRTTEVGDGPVSSIAVAAGTLVVGVDGVIRGFRTDGDGLTSRDEVVVP